MIVSMSSNTAQQGFGGVSSRTAGFSSKRPQQLLIAKQLPIGIESFRNAIGVKHDLISALELDCPA